MDIAKQYSAKVFLLYVVHESIQLLNFTVPEDKRRQMKDGAVPWTEKILQDSLGSIPQAKEVGVATNVRQGNPYDEMLKVEEKSIDLIVIVYLG